MKIVYLPSFVRQLKNLEVELQQEVFEKIELFKEKTNHKQLKVHKLYGRLKNRYSFYVNYKTRIVFIYLNKKEVVLLAVGDHSVYDK